ncbi:Flp family type IVb pilin [Anaerovibrio sp.]|uniref:Flp family type IVb pilin n=1 Tax=Anaerovibrio sp. TaxID=1872532 RepID=UPI00388E69C9
MKVMRYLEQKAQGMVEYALILAFVVGIAIALTNSSGIKGAIETTFSNVTKTLNEANGTTGTSGGSSTSGGSGTGGN